MILTQPESGSVKKVFRMKILEHLYGECRVLSGDNPRYELIWQRRDAPLECSADWGISRVERPRSCVGRDSIDPRCPVCRRFIPQSGQRSSIPGSNMNFSEVHTIRRRHPSMTRPRRSEGSGGCSSKWERAGNRAAHAPVVWICRAHESEG
jgi:hypothetical protein